MKFKSKGYVLIILAVIELSLLPVVSSIGAANIGILQLLFFVFLTSSAVSFASVASSGNAIITNTTGLYFIGIAIVSTLATALSNIIIRGRNGDIFGQVFVFNLSSFIFIGAIILLMYIPFAAMNSYSIISFLFLGGITYSLGALMFFYTLKMFNPLLVANSMYATPVLTIIFSYLLIGTKFYIYYAYSFAFIILALVIQQHYAKQAPSYRTKEAKHKNTALFDISGAFINSRNNEIANAIGANGRALAVKVGKGFDIQDANRYGCIAFTTKDVKGYANKEEIEFIRDVIGAKEEGEDVLVCIGKTDEAEKLISEHLEAFENRQLHDEKADAVGNAEDIANRARERSGIGSEKQ